MSLKKTIGLFPRQRRASIAFSSTPRRFYSSFVERATAPTSKTQVYISRSRDPYLNLSIEHYLLQKTPEDSTILFIYTNSRSVIIGRNQNPWTEVRLTSIRQPSDGPPFQLVRRRSGGGTVMHDEGNVNYSVICPSKIFDRDKHAQMVVEALKGLGVDTARVNCRHDIVVDIKSAERQKEKTYKISGSAFKLTRLRSLHHGTCLLSSPNLKRAGQLLSATGKGWLKARGVESVRSPITNVQVKNDDFEKAVIKEFNKMYGSDTNVTFVGEEEGSIPEIASGVEELRSEDWIYHQTPQFTFTSDVAENANSKLLQLLPRGLQVNFTIRHGRITEADIQHPSYIDADDAKAIQDSILNRPLHEIRDWQTIFSAYAKSSEGKSSRSQNPGIAFDHIFGVKEVEG